MSNKGVCRTAPATLGLFIMIIIIIINIGFIYFLFFIRNLENYNCISGIAMILS